MQKVIRNTSTLCRASRMWQYVMRRHCTVGDSGNVFCYYETNSFNMLQPCGAAMPRETSGITRQHKPVYSGTFAYRERGFTQSPPCFLLHNRGCLQSSASLRPPTVCYANVASTNYRTAIAELAQRGNEQYKYLKSITALDLNALCDFPLLKE